MSNLYSILDTRSGCYGSLMTFTNDATAIRAFIEMLISGDSNSMLALYPTDYVLSCIGQFDQQTGLINSNVPSIVINGIEALNRATEEARRRRLLQYQLSGHIDEETVDKINSDDNVTLGPDPVTNDN